MHPARRISGRALRLVSPLLPMGWIDHYRLAGVAGDPSEANATAWERYLMHVFFDDDSYPNVAVGRNFRNIRDELPHEME